MPAARTCSVKSLGKVHLSLGPGNERAAHFLRAVMRAQTSSHSEAKRLLSNSVPGTWMLGDQRACLRPLGGSQAPAHGSVQPEKSRCGNAKAQRCQDARVSVPGQLRQAQRQNHGRTESCNERKSLDRKSVV